MLRLDLIKKAVEDQLATEQKNIVHTTNYLEKPLYYTENTVTKAVSSESKTVEQTINPRDLFGTKIVFPSDEAAKDGGYLIYLSPSFVQGKTVYKLYDKQSSEQRKNTVKVKESNVDKYIYQVDPNGDPSQETTEDGEEIPQVDNLDKAVTRNREQTISPKTEVETDEEYQARFMEEYHDLVRDINGELREIDPEMVRKQLVARAKEKELAAKTAEVDRVEASLLSVLESEEQCVTSYPSSTKSILNFKTILKAQNSFPICGSEIERFIDKELSGISQDIKDKLKAALKNKQISPEKFAELKKEFEFIKRNLSIYADQSDQISIREQLCAIMLLDLISSNSYDTPPPDLESLYADFYDNYIGSYGLVEMGMRVKENDAALAAVTEIAPDAPNKYQRVRTLIDTLKYLSRLPNKEAVEAALETSGGRPNVFAHEAGNFIAAFLGLRNTATAVSATYPGYLAAPVGFTPIVSGSNQEERDLSSLEAKAEKELKAQIAAEQLDNPNLTFNDIFLLLVSPQTKNYETQMQLLNFLVELRSLDITKPEDQTRLDQIINQLKKLETFPNLPEEFELNISNVKNIILSLLTSTEPKRIGKLLASNEDDTKIKNLLKFGKIFSGTPAYDAYKKAKEEQRQKNIQKLGILSGLTTDLPDASLEELFDDLVIFNSDNERTKIILSKIADNLLSKVGCTNKDSDNQCKQLKAAIIHYLSIKREVLYDQSSINTPLGEFFESLITLEVLNKILTNNEIDPASFSYNGKTGIEALTEYLKCSSNTTSKTLKPMDSIFASTGSGSTAPKGYELSEVPKDHPGAGTINKVKTILESADFRKKVLGDSDAQELETLSQEIFTLENAKNLNDKEKATLEEKKQKRNALREDLLKAAFLHIGGTETAEQKKAVSFFYGEQTFDSVLANLDLYKSPSKTSARPTRRKNREDLKYAMKSLAKDAIEEEEKLEDVEQIPQINSGNNPAGSPQPAMTAKQKQIATNTAVKGTVSTYSRSIPEKDKGRKIADFEVQLKKGNYTLDESGNITVFDNKGQAISTVKVEPTDLPHLPAQTKPQPASKSFSYFYSLQNFLVLKSVKSKSENCPILDPNKPDDSNNSKAFLRVNCKDGNGVYYIGFSKAAGIDGSEAGFGDVAFFKANNVMMDDKGNLTRVDNNQPITLDFQVFEGKLVKNRQAGVNFNAFGRFSGCAQMAILQIESLRKKDSSGKVIEPRLNADFKVFKFQGSLGDISIEPAKAQKKAIGSMAGKFVLNFREDSPLKYGRNLAGILFSYNAPMKYKHRFGGYIGAHIMPAIKRNSLLDNLLAYVRPNEYLLGLKGIKGKISEDSKDKVVKLFSRLEENSATAILKTYETSEDFVAGIVEQLEAEGITLDLNSKFKFSDGDYTLKQRLSIYYESLKARKDYELTEEDNQAIAAVEKIIKAFSLQDLPITPIEIKKPKKGVSYTGPNSVESEIETFRKKKINTQIDDAKVEMFSLLGISPLSENQATKDAQIAAMLTINDSLITSDEFSPLIPSLVEQIKIAKSTNPNATAAELFATAFNSEEFKRKIIEENSKRKAQRETLFQEGNSFFGTSLPESALKDVQKFGSARALALYHIFLAAS